MAYAVSCRCAQLYNAIHSAYVCMRKSLSLYLSHPQSVTWLCGCAKRPLVSHTHTQYWQYLRIWVCWCRHILAPGPKYVSSCSQHISAISVTKILSLFESRESLQQNYKQRHTYRRASFMKSVRAHCRNHWNGKCMCVATAWLNDKRRALSSLHQPNCWHTTFSITVRTLQIFGCRRITNAKHANFPAGLCTHIFMCFWGRSKCVCVCVCVLWLRLRVLYLDEFENHSHRI